MPKIKSAIKRVEIAKRNQVRNKPWKSAVRNVRSKVVDVLGNKKESIAALNAAYALIDRAVAKGILKKNNAARKKSKLALAINRHKAK